MNCYIKKIFEIDEMNNMDTRNSGDVKSFDQIFVYSHFRSRNSFVFFLLLRLSSSYLSSFVFSKKIDLRFQIRFGLLTRSRESKRNLFRIFCFEILIYFTSFVVHVCHYFQSSLYDRYKQLL